MSSESHSDDSVLCAVMTFIHYLNVEEADRIPIYLFRRGIFPLVDFLLIVETVRLPVAYMLLWWAFPQDLFHLEYLRMNAPTGSFPRDVQPYDLTVAVAIKQAVDNFLSIIQFHQETLWDYV